MSWVTVGIMAGSAALQARQADARRKQQESFNKSQAETTRYSPWTEMKGRLDQSYIPDSLTAAAGGAIQGLGMAQGLQGAFGSMGGGSQPAFSQGFADGQVGQPTMDQFSQALDQQSRMGLGQKSISNMQPGLYSNPWNIG